MARRRRLNPAQPTYLSAAPPLAATGQPALRAGLSVAPPIAQVAGEASATAALREVSAALDAARTDGRLMLRLPLAAVEADYLVRDRLVADADDMAHLVASIAEHGQRSPIEVAELAPGRYGLISGWRRLRALARLAEEDGARFGTVLAQLRHPDTAASAYVAMIEENEIRVGLSYYERARVTAKAVEAGVFPSEKAALQRLFSAASRARRSKIGSFLAIHQHLDTVLRFPAALPERLGLALARLLETDPALARPLATDLAAKPPQTAAEEQSRLARFVAEQSGPDDTDTVSARTEPLLGAAGVDAADLAATGVVPLVPETPIPFGNRTPDAKISDATDPVTSSRGTAAPDSIGRHATSGNTTGSDTTATDASGPKTTGPDKTDPKTRAPETANPDTAGADRTAPDAAAAHTPTATDPAPLPAPPLAPDSREIRPGLFLRVSGGWTNPTLELSGPAVDPVLRERLEIWLATGR